MRNFPNFVLLKKWPKTYLETFKKKSPPLSAFLIYFLFITLIRTFLESIYSAYVLDLATYFHIFFSFLWVSTSIMMVTKIYFPEENSLNIAKVILGAMTIIILPPVIDLIITSGEGLYMTYYVDNVKPNVLVSFWKEFFTFFGFYKGYGATPGIKIEIGIVLIFGFFFSYSIKSKNILFSLLYIFSVYFFIVVLGFFPYLLIKFFLLFGSIMKYDHRILGIWFSIFTLINILILLFFKNGSNLKINIYKKNDFLILFPFILIGAFLQDGFLVKIIISQELLFRILLGFLSILPILFQDFSFGNNQKKIMTTTSIYFSFCISFLACFFLILFYLSEYYRNNLKPFIFMSKIFFSISIVSLMAFGCEIFFPYSFLKVNQIILGITFGVLFPYLTEKIQFKTIPD